MESAASITRFDWTEENIAIARHGVESGLSHGQIGLKLGCTRNTVIGKMTSMGVKSPNAKGHKPGVPAPWKSIPKAPRPNMMTINAKAARPPPIPIEKPVQPPSEPPRTSGKAFMELAPHDCRWPYGDVGEEGFFFCGHEAVKGLTYCSHHYRIAYRPTPRQEPAKFWVAA